MLFRPNSTYISSRLVANALEHFWDYAYLGNHPLAQLACVENALASSSRATHLERGHALHYMLRRAIDATQVSCSRRLNSNEQLYYPILYNTYIEQLDNRLVAKAVCLSERSLYRYLTKALLVVTQLLDDWESAAQE